MSNPQSTFKLWADVYYRMNALANQRGLKLSRLINIALTEWLQQQPDLSKHDAFEQQTQDTSEKSAHLCLL